MSNKYERMVEDIKATVGEARSRLRAKGMETSDIAFGLMAEAIIEMFGTDYGEQVLYTIAKRCIGYSEELMGMCVVEQFRNSGKSVGDIREVERIFTECQDNRAQRGQSTIEQAARAVSEKRGPFPTAADLRQFRKY